MQDQGDGLHTSRNQLDSAFIPERKLDYSDPGNKPVRWLAEGRDPSATDDASNATGNDGDNEITGVYVSDGDTSRDEDPRREVPNLADNDWRWFWTQHARGINFAGRFSRRPADDSKHWRPLRRRGDRSGRPLWKRPGARPGLFYPVLHAALRRRTPLPTRARVASTLRAGCAGRSSRCSASSTRIRRGATALSLPELVDLYGRNAFDVLCVTDHVHRTDDPWLPADTPPRGVHADHADYLAEIEAQAERARRARYDHAGRARSSSSPTTTSTPTSPPCRRRRLPRVRRSRRRPVGSAGTEPPRRARRSSPLTHSAPAGAPCLRESPCASPASGAPFAPRSTAGSSSTTTTCSGWVAERGLPAVANGDFHRPEHLHGWKTLLPCAKDEAAVVEYLRVSPPGLPHPHRRARRGCCAGCVAAPWPPGGRPVTIR